LKPAASFVALSLPKLPDLLASEKLDALRHHVTKEPADSPDEIFESRTLLYLQRYAANSIPNDG
jgi:hypothetical protein